MSGDAVSNTTAILALGNAGNLNILKDIYSNIYIPEAVANEIKSVNIPSWINILKIQSHESYNVLTNTHGLHPGEAEAIILADELCRVKNIKALLLDEGQARKHVKFYFKSQQYPQIHPLPMILKIAEKKGLVTDFRQEIKNYDKNGYYKLTADDKIRYFRNSTP
ncbi:hypothetical protein [Gracilibacillus thailandensis]|uniref:Uncharacterized protein n=2 Tax=Gracilibacillus thailandensis TaxID=563735 RepID=A0A6N7QWF0_9BACI|nr:hypothetical protein [Gracilibacillus thailandensis]MRI65215.1 hypothetical protein [Gracilibacillus thailandensis]